MNLHVPLRVRLSTCGLGPKRVNELPHENSDDQPLKSSWADSRSPFASESGRIRRVTSRWPFCSRDEEFSQRLSEQACTVLRLVAVAVPKIPRVVEKEPCRMPRLCAEGRIELQDLRLPCQFACRLEAS